MNPFRNPLRVVAVVGGPIVAGVMVALFAAAGPVVATVPPTVHEDIPTTQERRQGRCEALSAEQATPELRQIAAALAEQEGCP